MKQLILSISLVLFFGPLLTLAQPNQQYPRAERIHAIKIGYLTDRLHLSPEQATSFWPIYNQYEQERGNARRTFRQNNRNQNRPETEEQAAQYIDDNLDFQQQILSINKKYKDEFLHILSAQQLAALYDAERDFKRLLLQQLKDRRGRR